MVNLYGQTIVTSSTALAVSTTSSSSSSSSSSPEQSTHATPEKKPTLRMRLHDVSQTSPPPDPASLSSPQNIEQSVNTLLDWFATQEQVLVITGAGLSTESGIPDYRGAKGSYFVGHKPMIHDQYMSHVSQRQRYWGRAIVGWRKFDKATPNQGHQALTALEAAGVIGVGVDKNNLQNDNDNDDDGWISYHHDRIQGRRMSIITQNVDGLHRKAQTKGLTELHGRNDRVRCTKCHSNLDRQIFHDILEEANREWLQAAEAWEQRQDADDSSVLRPDGDAHLSGENGAPSFQDVVVPPCPFCGSGFVKPNVVFFGDSVPLSVVQACRHAVSQAQGLLVVGSSLAVHSAFRFVRQASVEEGKEVALLNVGPTRADDLDRVLKVEAPAGPVLQGLVEALAS